MKRALICCAVIMLTLPAGMCVTTRYIPIGCVGKDQKLPPEPPKVADRLTGRADEDVKVLGGSAIRLRAWGQGLQTILEGCREK